MKKVTSIVLLVSLLYAALPLRAVSFFSILPDGRSVAPAGFGVSVGDYPSQLVLSPDGKYVAALMQGDGELDVFPASGVRDIERYPVSGATRMLWTANALYVARGASGTISRFNYTPSTDTRGSAATVLTAETDLSAGAGLLNGLAEGPATHILYAARTENQEIVAIDEASDKVVQHLRTDGQPFAVAFVNGTLFATLYNGTSVDAWPDASGSATAIATGQHPTEILSDGNDRAYVANANGHDIAVIDAKTLRVVRRIELAANPHEPPGRTPAGMALSQGGSELFVAESGTNDVAVVNLASGRVTKRIPTAWYPMSVVATVKKVEIPIIPGQTHGGTQQIATSLTALWIADAKGYGAQADPAGEWDGTYQGVLQHVVAEAYTGHEYVAAMPKLSTVPADGLPPIKHVIFIVKENKHFDEEFGDMPGVDGDPNLVLYGRKYTPNAHALAERYAVFDRFMSNGEASIYGHTWTTQGWTDDYQERNTQMDGNLPDSIWPESLAGRQPLSVMDFVWYQNLFALPGQPWLNTSGVFGPRGELIDELQRKHVPFRVYGEQMTLLPNGRIAPGLAAHADRDFPGVHIDFQTLDTQRAKLFLQDIAKHGLAAYSYMTLPTDHTAGVQPGYYLPQSYIADNDVALGQIIAGLSKRKDWQNTIVIVTMDDPQGTGDHYDDHRMPAFMIGPYVRRHFVDHTHFDQASVLRTVEVLFHLDPLSIYDAMTPPMTDAFARQPDDAPYTALPAGIPIIRVAGMPRQTSFELDGPEWRNLPNEEWLALKGPRSLAQHLAYLSGIELQQRLAFGIPNNKTNAIAHSPTLQIPPAVDSDGDDDDNGN